MTSQRRTYTCPMHPEVRQPKPGSCPKCGMALEPVGAEAPSARTEYVCPMHPQIVRDAPGSCPICGMRSEEHTSELQSRLHLVCRLLLEKKKKKKKNNSDDTNSDLH